MMDEKKDFALFKIGFASKLMIRIYAYTTHNPLAECICYMQTQEKSKRNLEKAFHAEIKSLGLEFVYAIIDGKKTEWFKVDYNSPLYENLKNKGLAALKSGRGHKCYTLQK
jgi:hypothetical protein